MISTKISCAGQFILFKVVLYNTNKAKIILLTDYNFQESRKKNYVNNMILSYGPQT